MAGLRPPSISPPSSPSNRVHIFPRNRAIINNFQPPLTISPRLIHASQPPQLSPASPRPLGAHPCLRGDGLSRWAPHHSPWAALAPVLNDFPGSLAGWQVLDPALASLTGALDVPQESDRSFRCYVDFGRLDHAFLPPEDTLAPKEPFSCPAKRKEPSCHSNALSGSSRASSDSLSSSSSSGGSKRVKLDQPTPQNSPGEDQQEQDGPQNSADRGQLCKKPKGLLERNRLAASKSRQKKKNLELELKSKLTELSQRSSQLKSTVTSLLVERFKLMKLFEDHQLWLHHLSHAQQPH